jgi:hypothetical protein
MSDDFQAIISDGDDFEISFVGSKAGTSAPTTSRAPRRSEPILIDSDSESDAELVGFGFDVAGRRMMNASTLGSADGFGIDIGLDLPGIGLGKDSTLLDDVRVSVEPEVVAIPPRRDRKGKAKAKAMTVEVDDSPVLLPMDIRFDSRAMTQVDLGDVSETMDQLIIERLARRTRCPVFTCGICPTCSETENIVP